MIDRNFIVAVILVAELAIGVVFYFVTRSERRDLYKEQVVFEALNDGSLTALASGPQED